MSDATPEAAARPPHSERDLRILRGFAQRIDAADAGAHNNLGVLYFNKGMYEEAIAQFQRALAIDPKMQVAQRNLEIAYFNTG
ncbi:MAG TPA: tetratricopeptide repeat protein, partial [Longimicrobium sp.]|nr:tetratricopeptide repeat protein [Longimicrobium sp.]